MTSQHLLNLWLEAVGVVIQSKAQEQNPDRSLPPQGDLKAQILRWAGRKCSVRWGDGAFLVPCEREDAVSMLPLKLQLLCSNYRLPVPLIKQRLAPYSHNHLDNVGLFGFFFSSGLFFAVSKLCFYISALLSAPPSPPCPCEAPGMSCSGALACD